MLTFLTTGLITLIIGAILLAGWHFSAPGHAGPQSDHFDGVRFINPEKVRAKGFWSLLKWMILRRKGVWMENYETTIGPRPVSASKNLRITFVNHSSFLIQWNELNILTDPIWSERCSPVAFAGPLRMRPPGIRFDDLPHIDLVVISHNHYDHLDLPTLQRIEALYHPVYVVPLGVRTMLRKQDFQNIVELDWWEKTAAGISIKAVPAQHFSSRGSFDRNRTLWCGYIFEADGQKLYFAGDSGYGEFFREIGKKEGPIDVSLLPIGAYLPRWFMAPIHVAPDEAVKIHQDVRSRQSIAMHFGTFPLADEGQGRPEEDLILALQQAGINQKEFIIPEEGKAMDFPLSSR